MPGAQRQSHLFPMDESLDEQRCHPSRPLSASGPPPPTARRRGTRCRFLCNGSSPHSHLNKLRQPHPPSRARRCLAASGHCGARRPLLKAAGGPGLAGISARDPHPVSPRRRPSLCCGSGPPAPTRMRPQPCVQPCPQPSKQRPPVQYWRLVRLRLSLQTGGPGLPDARRSAAYICCSSPWGFEPALPPRG